MSSKRFTVEQTGPRHDGSPNFTVRDTMPRLDFHGIVADFDLRENAQAYADDCNARWAEVQPESVGGYEWREIAERRGHYAWLRPEAARKEYVRLTFRQADGTTRTVWALKVGPCKYFVANKDGDTETDMGVNAAGVSVERKELVLASPEDIVSEKPAYMSRKYGWLEMGATDPDMESGAC